MEPVGLKKRERERKKKKKSKQNWLGRSPLPSLGLEQKPHGLHKCWFPRGSAA